ncbi:MAG: hypothetical protein ACK559_29715, partial [bacterium]
PHVRSRRIHGDAQMGVGKGVGQHRHLRQRRLDVVERLLHGRPPNNPLRPLRTALEAVRERLENTGRRRDKTQVEVHEAQEPLQLLHRGWSGEFGDGLHMVRERRHAGGGHSMPQKVHRLDTKNTFLQINH